MDRPPKATFFVQRHLFSGPTSFAELKQRIAALPEEKSRGDAFEQFVKAYLLLEPEYSSKLKHVWLGREVPQALSAKLNLPAGDEGIDLVAETNDGGFWAIQCKFRQDTDQSLTWREVSTFTGLAFGVCRGISFGLICSTTERITHVLKKQERIGFCALDVWQGLDADFFKRLRAHFAHKTEALKPAEPHPHQRAAIKDAHQHFITSKEKRGKLIMPCGSGKSLTAYWIAGELNARRIVIAVPSLALIRQTLKVWLRETMANHQAVEWICICSDESAGRVERDDVAVLRQDLGVPCLTAPDEIAAWLKRKQHGLTVVFTTYQSGEAIAKAARSAKYHFDLGIMDEAHKTVGDGDKLFSHLLHDTNLAIRRRIFMTATERRYAGQSDKVLSMENPVIYGETFHLLSFKRALEYVPSILSDYKIISIAVSRDQVAELIRKNVFVKPDKGKWNKEIEAEMLASLIALRKAMSKYPIHHAVSFHSSIQRADLFKTHNDVFSRTFPKYESLETFHVSGKTPTGTRARIIGDFAKTKRALITNARCLTEGVDVPGIDCVLFADPRKSAVDIVQAIGRALRPAPGKKLGYVIVPILHDADATPNDIFESESFQEILTTLRALAANDDRIIEYFRGVSQGRQHTGGGSVEFDIDERLAKQINLAQFVREIDLKCWNRLAKLSWRPFDQARAFARNLKLKSSTEWNAFCRGKIPRLERLPVDIPASPERIYADKGWQGVGDWLGTGRIADQYKRYLPFEQARALVRRLHLKKIDDWYELCRNGKKPENIPAAPNNTYKNSGWIGIADWLGTKPGFDGYLPFKKARRLVHALKLPSTAKWFEYCKGSKKPHNIPTSPPRAYKIHWKGWPDWLGHFRPSPQEMRAQFWPFEKARRFVRKLGLQDYAEWKRYVRSSKRPLFIPSSPNRLYGAAYISLPDWLGTRIGFKGFLEYAKAEKFARKLKLQSSSEWRQYVISGKLPVNIPRSPEMVYLNKGWKSWGDWLGTGRIADNLRTFRPFKEARAFARKLKVKSGAEWFTFCKGEMPRLKNLPVDIPAHPATTYAHKGWKSMGDWLGTGTVASFLRKYRSFGEARTFARKLKLKGTTEWNAFCKGKLPHKGQLPADIPAAPRNIYADKGWKGMGDWLGNGRTRRSDLKIV